MKTNEEIQIKSCVGCGFCCMQAKCVAGQRLYPASKICPALDWIEEKNRYLCKLMCLPGNIGFEFRHELYAGAGCCSNMNGWRQNVQRRELEETKKETNLESFFQIFLHSLGKQLVGGDVLSLTLSG